MLCLARTFLKVFKNKFYKRSEVPFPSFFRKKKKSEILFLLELGNIDRVTKVKFMNEYHDKANLVRKATFK